MSCLSLLLPPNSDAGIVKEDLEALPTLCWGVSCWAQQSTVTLLPRGTGRHLPSLLTPCCFSSLLLSSPFTFPVLLLFPPLVQTVRQLLAPLAAAGSHSPRLPLQPPAHFAAPVPPSPEASFEVGGSQSSTALGPAARACWQGSAGDARYWQHCAHLADPSWKP